MSRHISEAIYDLFTHKTTSVSCPHGAAVYFLYKEIHWTTICLQIKLQRFARQITQYNIYRGSFRGGPFSRKNLVDYIGNQWSMTGASPILGSQWALTYENCWIRHWHTITLVIYINIYIYMYTNVRTKKHFKKTNLTFKKWLDQPLNSLSKL